MLEGELQKNIIELAEFLHWRVYHVTNVRGRLRAQSSVGYPDLTMVRAPRLIFAELKRQKKQPTDAQQAWRRALRQVYVEDEMEEHPSPVEVYLWRPSDWLSGEIERILK